MIPFFIEWRLHYTQLNFIPGIITRSTVTTLDQIKDIYFENITIIFKHYLDEIEQFCKQSDVDVEGEIISANDFAYVVGDGMLMYETSICNGIYWFNIETNSWDKYNINIEEVTQHLSNLYTTLITNVNKASSKVANKLSE